MGKHKTVKSKIFITNTTKTKRKTNEKISYPKSMIFDKTLSVCKHCSSYLWGIREVGNKQYKITSKYISKFIIQRRRQKYLRTEITTKNSIKGFLPMNLKSNENILLEGFVILYGSSLFTGKDSTF